MSTARTRQQQRDADARAWWRLSNGATPYPEPAAPVSPFRVDDRGVWLRNDHGAPTRICAPLSVVSETRAWNGGGWGRLLEWRDADGQLHRLSVSLSHCTGPGRWLGQLLANGGLAIEPGPANLAALAVYVVDAEPQHTGAISVPGVFEGWQVPMIGEAVQVGAEDIA